MAFGSQGAVDVQKIGKRYHFQLAQPVHAPPQVVWQVMTDHPGYADVADNLSMVRVLSGDGLGMRRECAGPKGESWTETCDLYEEGRAFGFQVHTDASDYPYPFSHVSGRWSVTDTGFRIDISAEPKGGVLMRLLFGLAAPRKFRQVLLDLGKGWAERMEREAQSIKASPRSPARS